ncbi:hypothetical protein DVH24_004873 [Malus domestica]|uniref:Uncharacterized protein n=1 Tax=Malus domestica TaxID=3750 RepID=A0A498ID73_MALDO|nr:hypothetical protein DVH24_004873 [Malus domestica]
MVFVSKWSSLCVQLWYGVLDFVGDTEEIQFFCLNCFCFDHGTYGFANLEKMVEKCYTFVGFGTIWVELNLLAVFKLDVGLHRTSINPCAQGVNKVNLWLLASTTNPKLEGTRVYMGYWKKEDLTFVYQLEEVTMHLSAC